MNNQDNYIGEKVSKPREAILVALEQALDSGGEACLVDCYEVLSASPDGGKETFVGFTSQESLLVSKGIPPSGGSNTTNTGRFRANPHLGIKYPNPSGNGHLLAVIRLFTEDSTDEASRHRRSALAKLTNEEKRALGLGGLQ